MREATLYTIQSQRVVCGDYVEVSRMIGLKSNLFKTSEFDALVPINPPTVNIDRLPVHAISKIKHGQRSTDYIAIEPELREILEAPFVGELEKLELDKVRIDHENRQLRSALEGHENRLEHFNTCNWFRRVWHVICGGRV